MPRCAAECRALPCSDLSRDGSGILFDRIQESSRVALIERGGR
jgi:hypothetical protein